ncbi:hypothetical protein IIC_02505 [Bacillus cereus VD021]|uniref:Bacterial CdiA-CT RNAse A domain-containing protein n=1 Tax=Bacillus cereus VD021 TaxID=1053224 RepID=R8HQK1_BACCE|nr:RNase A-like domain-containing protein [Bacillus mycoides]EOO75051.1 hypothetical protein IIC_02505 [Bacillus cereus VD021]
MFDKLKDTVENNVEAMDQLYEKFIRQIENTPIIGQYHNYKKGKNEAVLDEPKGILNTILHPIDSVEGAVYALSHIDETFAAVEQAISDSWNQDVVNGDWNSRAKWVGNVEMQVKLAIAELFVGTKGVDKISKLGKVSKLGKTSKLSESVNFIQGIKNVINFDKFKQSVDMLNNILMPKNQFALADTNAFNLKSFDYTTFNKAKDTFSFAENIDRSNQYSPRVFDGDLKKHEDKGGHLIERHVEIPDEALAQRLIDDQNITGSSSFNDLEKAQKVADAVLTNPQNIRKIERWLADSYSPPTLALRYRGDEIIGRSILRTSEDVLEVTNAKIVLKKDGEGSYIRTGFPIR